jgi:hypothetical protein
MSQEKKAEIAANLKRALAGIGVSYSLSVRSHSTIVRTIVSYSLSVRNHSTIVMTIRQSSIDFIGNYNANMLARHCPVSDNPQHDSMSINPYWYKEHFTGEALAFLSLVMPILNDGNHDRSDTTTDYFDVGWYVDVKIGEWGKPYVLTTLHAVKQAV